MKIPILNWDTIYEYYHNNIDDKPINHIYHKNVGNNLKCRVIDNNYFGIKINIKLK